MQSANQLKALRVYYTDEEKESWFCHEFLLYSIYALYVKSIHVPVEVQM